jgi:hypothetical protein
VFCIQDEEATILMRLSWRDGVQAWISAARFSRSSWLCSTGEIITGSSAACAPLHHSDRPLARLDIYGRHGLDPDYLTASAG